jgi:HK97 gp10 family phage protein
MGCDASEMASFGGGVRRRALRIGVSGATVVKKAAYDLERGTKAQIQAMGAVDTGNMLNSVSTDISGDGRFGAMSAEVGPTADYSIYVHEGTSRMAGRPFLSTAFDAMLPGFEGAVGKLGGEILP